jgi:FkbM family methyltransferase
MLGLPLDRDVKSLIQSISPPPILRWREARYFHKYGEVELRLVGPMCDADRDSIDVGANLGAYVHFMRRWSRLVLAFEPVPWLAELLSRKFPSRVVVRDLALSDRNGTALLHIPVARDGPDPGLAALDRSFGPMGSSRIDLEVTTRRLDDAYAGNLGFMKIDVEGHEQAVLDGAAGTIERCRPNVLVEIEERFAPDGVGRARKFFDAIDYGGYFVDQGSLKEIDNFDARSMQREENIAGFAAGIERRKFPGYVNNFIFIPRTSVRDIVPAIGKILGKEKTGGWRSRIPDRQG